MIGRRSLCMGKYKRVQHIFLRGSAVFAYDLPYWTVKKRFQTARIRLSVEKCHTALIFFDFRRSISGHQSLPGEKDVDGYNWRYTESNLTVSGSCLTYKKVSETKFFSIDMADFPLRFCFCRLKIKKIEEYGGFRFRSCFPAGKPFGKVGPADRTGACGKIHPPWSICFFVADRSKVLLTKICRRR